MGKKAVKRLFGTDTKHCHSLRPRKFGAHLIIESKLYVHGTVAGWFDPTNSLHPPFKTRTRMHSSRSPMHLLFDKQHNKRSLAFFSVPFEMLLYTKGEH